MEFKHTCGYGIADIQPECNCYEEFKKKEKEFSNKNINEIRQKFKQEVLQLIKDKLEYIEKNVNPTRGGALIVHRVDEVALIEIHNAINKL